jgi:nudix-type nucleoside diphosphatase (YffH/AdpP family)
MIPAESLFLYGTLRHLPLLEIVAGRAVAPRRARLAGHAVFTIAGADYPVILPEPGAVSEGMVLSCDAAMRARLDYYEAGFGYELREVGIETAQGPERALVYFGIEDPAEHDGPWSLEAWEARWAETTVIAAEESMARFGDWSPEVLARRFPTIRARAWSRVQARTSTPATIRSDPGVGAVRTDRVTRRHTGFFALDEVLVDHATFAGGRSGSLRREGFVGMDAALVLPYDPATDRVLLVEQFRIGPFLRGDARPWTLEPVAGLVDPGETPAETARREAMEEAGLTFDRLEPVIAGYPSPGATTEFFHCFIGICGLSGRVGAVAGGLSHEDEDIRTHVLDRERALDLVTTGEANVIPLVMLLLWAGANRQRLAGLP